MTLAFRRQLLALGLLVSTCLALTVATRAEAASTVPETTGSVAHTWTNYLNAGGTEGPTIPKNATVQISCKVTGFAVANGNTWWYRIGSAPWNDVYYVSADAFYNNGATSGPLAGTPYVDPAVPDCSSLGGVSETTGSVAHTWTNYLNAGGTEGPTIPKNATVQISCKVTGFAVANGNTWWYRIGSAPWNDVYYVSADAFYNNGATSGPLAGTPYVDPAVPDCGTGGGGGGTTGPTVTVGQGPPAPAGYRYAVTLAGFSANSSVSVRCYDSVSPSGFYTFSLRTNGSGGAFTQKYCYSGDGPDHWVIAGGVESNHVAWGGGTAGGGGGNGGGGGTTTPVVSPPAGEIARPATGDGPLRMAASTVTGSSLLVRSYKLLINSCRIASYYNCAAFGDHYLDKSATDRWISMGTAIYSERPLWALLEYYLRKNARTCVDKLSATPVTESNVCSLNTGWQQYSATGNTDYHWALGTFSVALVGDLWVGATDASGQRPLQLRYRLFLWDRFDYTHGDFSKYGELVTQGRASEFRVYGETKRIEKHTTVAGFRPEAAGLEW